MGRVKAIGQGVRCTRAKALRHGDTPAETRLWRALRDRRLGGWKWKRQFLIGPFIADFYCAEAKLVVEVDGGQHAEAEAYDDRRTAYLQRCGLRVIRFWNSDVLANANGVCLTILHACSASSSPRLRGED